VDLSEIQKQEVVPVHDGSQTFMAAAVATAASAAVSVRLSPYSRDWQGLTGITAFVEDLKPCLACWIGQYQY